MANEIVSMDAVIKTSVDIGPYAVLNKELQKVQDRLKEINRPVNTPKDPLKPTRQSATAAVRAIVRQGEAARKAAVQTSAYGQAAARAAASSDRLKSVSHQWDKIAHSSRAASLAATAAIGASIKGAMNLQDSYKRTNNLLTTGGENAAEAQRNVNQMQKDGARYSAKYGVSQKSIADGYQELVKRGYDSNQALGAQKSLLQASIASGDSYSDVVHNATTTLESFGMRAKSTTGMIKNTKTVVNQMAYASDLTATDFQSMGKAMEYVGSTAHLSGVTLHETASAIGILSNNGLEADKAGTGLRKSLVSLQSPGKAAIQAMKEIGVSTKDFVKSNGDMKSMADIFAILNKHTQNMGKMDKGAVFHNLFGTTGQQAGTILAENVDQLRALDKQVQKSAKNNYVEKLSGKNMQSALAQWRILKENVKAVGLSLGADFLPAVNDALKSFVKLVGSFNDMPKAGKKMIAFGTMAVAALYPVAKVVSTITGALGSIQSLRGKTFSKLAEATTFAAVPLSAKPKINGEVIGPTEKALGSAVEASASTRGLSKLASLNGLKNLGSSLKGTVGKLNTTSFLNKASIAGIGLEIGGNVVSTIHSGVDSKAGGKSLWAGAGNAVGAGLGLALSGGNPLVAAIGSSIGGAVASAIADSKVVADLKNKLDGVYSDADNNTDKINKDMNSKSKSGRATRGLYESNGLRGQSYSLQDPNDPASYETKKSKKKPKKKVDPLSGLSDTNKDFIKSTQKLLKSANKDYLNIMATGSKSMLKKNRETYSSLTQSASKYQKSQDKNVSYLKKMGLISNDAAKKEVSSGDKRVANIKSTVHKIEATEKSGNGDRYTLVAKLNRQLLQLTSVGANKQKSILKKLQLTQTSLTSKQYNSVIKQSNRAYNATVKDARKSYRAQADNADKTYDKALKSAAAVYGVHSKQYASVKKLAEAQRTKTRNAAYDQYQKVVYWANKQRDETTKAAADAAGGVMGIMGAMATNLQNFISNPNALPFGGTQKPKTNAQALQNSFGNPGKKLGSKPMSGTAGTKTTSAFPKASPFANGTKRYPNGLPKTTPAIVNDGNGPEAIILSGRNRHVALPKGAHVLNAEDTRRAFGPQHFAGGTAKLKKTATKGNVLSLSVDGKGATKTYKKIRKDIGKSSKGLVSDTKRSTNQLVTNTEKQYLQLHKNLNTRNKSIGKDWNKSWKAVASDFNGIFGRLDGYASNGMRGAIKQLNRGFTGINATLNKFGGGSSVIPLVHYAKGSDGELKQDQMAMVNDAPNGPRQELIVRGNNVFAPKGKNRVLPLQKGDRVLNGHQSKEFMEQTGLQHYSKGSGVSKSGLKDLINSNAKNPGKAWSNDFSSKIGDAVGSAVRRGVTGTSKGGATSVGKPWNAEVWSQMKAAMESAAAGGNWSHTPGAGWSHTDVFGSPRSGGVHDGNDFSAGQGAIIHAVHGGKVVRAGGAPAGWGPVGYNIVTKGDDGQYVIYQEFGNAGNAKVSTGDTVRTGQAVASLGNSGLGTGPHVHIGVSKNYPFNNNGMSTSGWEDLMKMSGGSSGVKKAKAKNSPLSKLVKAELGNRLKWVTSNLGESDEVGASGSLSLSGGTGAHAAVLADALRKLYPKATTQGIAAILGNWSFESGLNPGAINPGGGASGLGQWLGGRKTALINYAKRHHQNWKNAGTQLGFALSGDGANSAIFKRILSSKGSVANLAAAFSSQWERGGYTAQHVNGAMKIARTLQGRKAGGPVKAGQIYQVHERGFELFKPNVDGRVVPHDEAAKKVGTGQPNIKIEQNITVHAEGNQKVEITKQVKQGTKQANQNLFEKLQEQFGFNAEGGLII